MNMEKIFENVKPDSGSNEMLENVAEKSVFGQIGGILSDDRFSAFLAGAAIGFVAGLMFAKWCPIGRKWIHSMPTKRNSEYLNDIEN